MTTRRPRLARGVGALLLAELLAGGSCVPRRALRPDFTPLPLTLQTAVAVDKDGNRILAGTFSGRFKIGDTVLESAGGSDAFVAKTDRAGRMLFAPERFGGTSDDAVTGVAVDDDLSIVVAGTFQGQVTLGATSLTASVRKGERGVFVAKLNASGRPLWFRQIGFTSLPNQVSVAVGPDHNIFIGASGVGTVGKEDMASEMMGESIFLALLGPDGVPAPEPLPKIEAMMLRPPCLHSKCIPGTRLDAQCDWCVALICSNGNDPYCCTTAWDSICVGEVWMCGQSCN